MKEGPHIMAKKATQMELSYAEKEMLSEALNLIHHGQKRRMKKLIMMGERLIDTLGSDQRKSDAIAESIEQFVPNEDFPVDSVLDQASLPSLLASSCGASVRGVSG